MVLLLLQGINLMLFQINDVGLVLFHLWFE